MPHQPNTAEPTADHLRLIVDTDLPCMHSTALTPGEFDALADLFLDREPLSEPGESSIDPRVAPQRARPRPPLEIIVPANLPRPPGGWLIAYARSRALTLGFPALLARADDGLATIQRIDPEPLPPGSAASEHSPAHSQGCPLALLAVQDMPGIPIDRRISRITVLSGAGETGAVAAYAAMKRLAPLLLAESSPRPHLGLCVVGASRERALDAHRALRRASDSFLSLRVEFAGAITHPDHAPCETIWRRDGAIVDDVLEAIELHASSAGGSCAQPSTPASERQPLLTPRKAPATESSPPLPSRMNRSTEPRELVLEARCPEAPDVRFRVDLDGALHLHMDDHSETTASAAAALLAASAWAERNRATLHALAIASGGSPLTTAAPICHLTTRDARRARPYLDTSIRLDVVAQPTAPGEPVRVALN